MRRGRGPGDGDSGCVNGSVSGVIISDVPTPGRVDIKDEFDELAIHEPSGDRRM
jgi:hypothetical protein